MEIKSKINDRFLVKAATSYVYTMSNFKRYINPIDFVQRRMNEEFPFTFSIEKYEAQSFNRASKLINLRYLLVKDNKSDEHALIFQGSEDGVDKIFSGEDLDWSNNLSSAAHLKLDNYQLAYEEFKYLRDVEGYNITSISGNSLGGGFALYIGTKEKNLRVIGVNPSPPESGQKFINKGNSTIILTSTDLLSRLLKTDPKRSTYGEVNAFIHIYGLEPLIIKRSIPFNNELNVAAAHVGDISDTYDFIMYTYNKNSLFYNAKIIGGEKGSKFSRLLLSTFYKQLRHTEYDEFVRNNIYPTLFPSTREFLDTFKYYPSLSDFMTFDLDGYIYSVTDGKMESFYNYTINDKYIFTSNIKRSFNNYYKSQKYFIDNSKCSLIDTRMNNDVVGYTAPKFIHDEVKLNLRFDWSIFKLLYDLPISVKFKFKDIFSNTLSDIVTINNNLNSNFHDNLNYSDEQIDLYVKELYAAIKTLDALNEHLHSSLDAFMYNIEQQVISGKKLFLFNVDHIKLNNNKLPSIDHLEELNDNLMKRCLSAVHDALRVDRDDIKQYFSANDKLIRNILEDLKLELTLKLKLKYNDADQKKLDQIEGLSNSIDFETLLNNISKEFELELSHLILGDSKIIEVYYNLKQMLERNDQFIKLLKMLDECLKSNYSQTQYKQYLIDKNCILDIIQSMNNIVLKLVD